MRLLSGPKVRLPSLGCRWTNFLPASTQTPLTVGVSNLSIRYFCSGELIELVRSKIIRARPAKLNQLSPSEDKVFL